MLNEEKRRLLLLSIILVIISMVATGAAVFLLYQASFAERLESLIVTAQSQARLIEVVARHDRENSQWIVDEVPDYDPVEASLQQVIAAHETFKGFGETGEFTLAQKVNDQIIFRFRHHADSVTKPAPVSFRSTWAEPMRRALNGRSGSMVGLDYRGKKVLAAYEPVKGMNLGIVTKIDISEVRQPFIRATLIAFSLTFVLIMAGVVLLRRTVTPLFNSLHATTEDLAVEMEQHKQALAALRESEARFRQIADVAEDVFWLVECENPDEPKVLYVNLMFEKIWQRSSRDILHNPQIWLDPVHPDDKEEVQTKYLRFLRGEGPFDLEFRLCQQDGAICHIWVKGGLIRDANGKITRAAGLAHDISAMKVAEDMVQAANLELEVRVEERTAALNRTIKLMTGREIRMAELKKEIAQLQVQLQAARGEK